MTLPTLNVISYETQLPSTGETIQYRPFTVKEEGILLTAMESKNPNDQFTSISQVLGNCIVSDNISVSKLKLYDVEYLFNMIGMASSGEIREVALTVEGKEEPLKMQCNMRDAYVYGLDVPQKMNIVLSGVEGNVSFDVEHFSFSQIKDIDMADGQTYLAAGITKIYNDDEVISASDVPFDELKKWVSGIPSKDMKTLKAFYENMPYLRYDIEYTDDEGNHRTTYVKGLNNFFL